MSCSHCVIVASWGTLEVGDAFQSVNACGRIGAGAGLLERQHRTGQEVDVPAVLLGGDGTGGAAPVGRNPVGAT